MLSIFGIIESWLEALDREEQAQERARKLRRVVRRQQAELTQMRRQQSRLCDQVDDLEARLALAEGPVDLSALEFPKSA